MKPILLYLIFCGLFFIHFQSSAQLKPQPEAEDENYEKEWAIGLNMNTNAGLIGGVNIRWSRKTLFNRTPTGENSYHHISLEMVNVKHPKEEQQTSAFTGNSFILRKTNYLFSIRPHFGREWILFRKAKEQGVQVNAIVAGGPSIGIVAPYLIRVASGSGEEEVQYDPEVHTNSNEIRGVGSIFKSLGQSSITAGVSAKASVVFELGSSNRSTSGFEAGTMIEYYPEQIEIMAVPDNYQFFTSIFLIFFFGARK
ncbi:hypothetical protein [Sediminitomix flava]|uniref:Outer membrane protein with beta-barrel domain n=1 Tax=Sediminitomix flava TaxID=379075 RepID=A0A315Z776_SEDFL|nr:hypothetical protein [Sediminitomix flava]PWJ39391.1 hypothetical protein BC781_106292 [Sediminitomix flava]